jgi:hypothetical protein
MKRLPRTARSVSNLPEPITQRLNVYALAAGAAGVGMLASAHPAQAKIVYTPANIPIVQNAGPVELDLNHDGIGDFQLSNVYTTERKRQPEGFHQSSLAVYPIQPSNRVRAVESNGAFEAAALRKGKNVGPHSPFQPAQSAMVMVACAGGTSGGGCGGAWLKVKHGYLGFKFVIKGKIHFGWARVRLSGESSPTITGYAYETIANKRIVTGQKNRRDETGPNQTASLSAPAIQTATLGRLAMGAPGLSIWRREESTHEGQQVGA